MKLNKILDAAANAFAGVKLGGKKSDPKLAELDRGVLTVGLLVAALDGTILPEEYAAFEVLAKRCRGGSAKNVRALLDTALPLAGQLMAMAQVGVYSEKERIAAFLAAAEKSLPRGFANGSMADLRRAFALWVTVGVADGTFSSAEKAAVEALRARFAEVALAHAKKEAEHADRLARLSPVHVVAYHNAPKGKAVFLEPEFIAQVEKISRDLANAAKRTKAEAALEGLIASVPTVDDKGKAVLRPAGGIAVKLATMAMVGVAATGSSEASYDSNRCCDGEFVHIVLEPRVVSTGSSKTENGWTTCCWCGCKIRYTRTFRWDPYEKKWVETTEYVPELCKKCQHKADRENR